MPYDEEIESRIQTLTKEWPNSEAKKMFGGICRLLNGNMVCGVYKEFLILRLGETAATEAMKEQYVRPFDITGRPMKGWVMVEKKGFETDDELQEWLHKSRDFVETLPSK
jgi:TfoX/Sxy family transcriptional regulator of competence genes